MHDRAIPQEYKTAGDRHVPFLDSFRSFMVGSKSSLVVIFYNSELKFIGSTKYSTQYPTISRIAKDYLVIQGSTVASEHSFSSGGHTGTARRNSLLPKTFEALQLLKSAYRQQHISATVHNIDHVLE